MLDQSEIKCGEAWFFNYKKEGDYCSPNSSSDKVINLDEFEVSTKKQVITKKYGFKKGGFEEVCCKNIEQYVRTRTRLLTQSRN